MGAGRGAEKTRRLLFLLPKMKESAPWKIIKNKE
jgi:hypothetical protein